jgi:hypothetical protein
MRSDMTDDRMTWIVPASQSSCRRWSGLIRRSVATFESTPAAPHAAWAVTEVVSGWGTVAWAAADDLIGCLLWVERCGYGVTAVRLVTVLGQPRFHHPETP